MPPEGIGESFDSPPRRMTGRTFVPPSRLERETLILRGSCSSQLSYGGGKILWFHRAPGSGVCPALETKTWADADGSEQGTQE